MVLLLTVILLQNSQSKTLEERQREEIKKSVFSELVKQNSLVLNEVTKEGKVNRCEFVFQYADTDKYGYQGEPVLLQGSFTLNYFEDKNLSYSLKLIPEVMDFSSKNTSWKVINPSYSGLIISTQLLDKYKVLQYPCEQGGICIAYDDKVYEISQTISKIISSNLPFDPTILYSLQKGGEDNKFNFSDVVTKKMLLIETSKYAKCVQKILNRHLDDVEKLK